MKQKLYFFCVLLFAIMAPAAHAQSGSCGIGLAWTINENTLTISGEGEMYDYSAPEYYSYSIYNEIIQKVILGEGVTTIGDHAFDGFINLSSVVFSNTITSIGEASFRNTHLYSIDLSSAISKVGALAFAQIPTLKVVNWESLL